MGSKSSSGVAQADRRIANGDGTAVSGDSNSVSVNVVDAGAFELGQSAVAGGYDLAAEVAAVARDMTREQSQTVRAIADDMGTTVADLYGGAGEQVAALLSSTAADSARLLDRAIGLVGSTLQTAGPDGPMANERRDMTIVIGLAMATVAGIVIFGSARKD